MLKSLIVNDAHFGRCLVTAEAIKKGELVVEEKPFAYGPKQNSGIICLGCYRYLKFDKDGDSLERCNTCDWPLCSACIESKDHAGECYIFAKAHVRFVGNMGEDGVCSQLDCITPLSTAANPEDRCSDVRDLPLCTFCETMNNRKYQAQWECKVWLEAKVCFYSITNAYNAYPQLDRITPLRLLLAMEADPTRWEREVAPMEHHFQERRSNADVWHADLINIAQYLRGPCKLAERFSEELIMKVVGILEVNAFEARTIQGYPLRCLYPFSGILAHNCVPNTARSIFPSEGYKIRLRAMNDLESGAHLYHSYTYTLDGTALRQAHLKAGKYFTCTCQRCKDATELGTNFSTFKCSKCEDGWLLTSDPLDEDVAWKCNVCTFKTSNAAVQKAVGVMQAEVAAVQELEMSAQRLEQTEQLMRKYCSVLHPLHFIQTGLKQNLIEMYGRVEGYGIVELPDVLLERKQELCHQVLRVLDVFEPGLSRARALHLYELHVPLVLLAKSGFVAGVVNRQALKKKLMEAIELLKECVDILQYEDVSTQEGTFCAVARKALEQLSESVEGLGDA